ncbi:MAG: transposase [Rhodospirillales bacterium]|nr:transposase [Rhodospirillales bacterium]
MRFNGILRGRKADLLPGWIDDAIETDLTPIVRFARTLSRNIDAVWNAIEMEWSNSQAEGQINRLENF